MQRNRAEAPYAQQCNHSIPIHVPGPAVNPNANPLCQAANSKKLMVIGSIGMIGMVRSDVNLH